MPRRTLAKDEVTVHVAAPPAEVYRLITDVSRMGEWSPETYECRWIGDIHGPVVGARFKARNRRGRLRWSNSPTVVVADPGREFAFSRTMPGSTCGDIDSSRHATAVPICPSRTKRYARSDGSTPRSRISLRPVAKPPTYAMA